MTCLDIVMGLSSPGVTCIRRKLEIVPSYGIADRQRIS